MAKVGRPRFIMDWDEFDKLCYLQCTITECAMSLKTSIDTVERCVKRKYGVNFAEIFKLKSSGANISLRRKRWQMAMDGNTQLVLHLSKVMLGEKDEINHSLDPVTVDVNYKAEWDK